MSTKDHCLNNFGSIRVPDATYHTSRPSGSNVRGTNFSEQFIKVITCNKRTMAQMAHFLFPYYFSEPFGPLYKRIGYNINVMRQSACLVV